MQEKGSGRGGFDSFRYPAKKKDLRFSTVLRKKFLVFCMDSISNIFASSVVMVRLV